MLCFRMTSRAVSRLFVRSIRMDLSLMEKQYMYSMFNPASVNACNVRENPEASESVTIANTSVRLALTLCSFKIWYACSGSFTIMRKMPYSDVSATVAAMMRMFDSESRFRICGIFPHLFSKKIEIW